MHGDCELVYCRETSLVEHHNRVDERMPELRAVMIISKSVIIVQKRDPIVDHAWRIDLTILLRQVFPVLLLLLVSLLAFSPLPSIHRTKSQIAC